MSKRKSSPLGSLMGASPRIDPPTPLTEETQPAIESAKIEAPPEEKSTPTVPQKEGKGQSKGGGRPREGLQRVRYDLPPEINQAVDERALVTGVAASQMVAFLLAHALHRFDAGELDPSPFFTKTKSPKFRHNLDVTFPLSPDSL